MNQLLGWLAGGDLRSDGPANDVVEFVLHNIELFDDLWEGLSAEDDLVRGRAADALEKLARTRPELFHTHVSEVINSATHDGVAMVRWHLGMTLGHLAVFDDLHQQIGPALLGLLDDRSAFTRSWAIVGVCILGRRNSAWHERALRGLTPLLADRSIAVRTRAHKGMALLADANMAFPEGWIKSERLAGMLSR
jgi:HEAT repeat protein